LPRWYLFAANFVRDFSANGVSVRGIFYDENPWIANYGKAGNKYNKQWFQTHVSIRPALHSFFSFFTP
jgi:hypothetical protein